MVNILNNLIALFQTILIMSGCAALLCGVILLMKAVAGRRMSARSHAWAWLVLIPALLVPFSLIFLPAGGWIAKSAEFWASVRQPVWLILSLVWLTGLMIFLAICFFSYQKACRMIRTAIYPTTAFWQERLNLLAVQVRLGKPEHVQLRQMDSNHGPFIVGLRRCYIVLPSSIFEQENNSLVDSILIHELIHIKHRDHWLHLLQCPLLCIHWFNPLCWLAFRLQQRDCEFYCDESSIQKISDQDRVAYAQALLATTACWTNAKESPHVDRLFTALFSEIDLRDRITRVLYKDKVSTIIAVAAAVLFAILAVCPLLPWVADTSSGNHSSSELSQTTSEPTPTISNPLQTMDNFVMEGAVLVKFIGSGEASKNVTIPDGVTSIGDSAFFNCSNLTSVTISDSVTSIGNSAFSECNNLTSITIPDSVTSIGEEAFYYCISLKSITMPEDITSIGKYAFSQTSISKPIIIDGGKRLFYVPDLYSTYMVPDGVTSIDEGAFESCNMLTSITIPDSVTSIGDRAFAECSNLASVTISARVTSIGDETFFLCFNLTSITIPDSVTSIGKGAFSECYNLTSITIPDSVTSIGVGAFSETNISKPIIIDDGKILCYVPKSYSTYTIPNTVLTIGREAFSLCSNLASVVIPDGVTSIGDYAFYNCTSLTSITIPDSVLSIEQSAFFGCKNLTSIVIPDSVVSIEQSTFFGCENLTSIVIPDRVTSIGEQAFIGCIRLTSITIPDRVTSIGDSAFSSCFNLMSVTIPDRVTSIGEDAFSHILNLTLHVHDGSYAKSYASSKGIPFVTDD